MTVSELIARIDRGLSRLNAEVEIQAAKAGTDLVALVTNRVVQQGKSDDGSQFSDYSDTQLPAFFFFGKSRTASGEAAVRRKAKGKEPVSYKDFRGLNNLNTSPKNFEFTGELFRNFSVLKIERTTTGVRVVIGGKTRAAEDKIRWNSEREGKSIIRPSQQEIQIVKNNLQAWVNSCFNG